ncbi:hypothetical protein BC831DRAFT_292999 [Entophlyctis helioformis]|nr:hypothetical protein BC831DRAFT_292999 [Entophlyctis helioformis]
MANPRLFWRPARRVRLDESAAKVDECWLLMRATLLLMRCRLDAWGCWMLTMCLLAVPIHSYPDPCSWSSALRQRSTALVFVGSSSPSPQSPLRLHSPMPRGSWHGQSFAWLPRASRYESLQLHLAAMPAAVSFGSEWLLVSECVVALCDRLTERLTPARLPACLSCVSAMLRAISTISGSHSPMTGQRMQAGRLDRRALGIQLPLRCRPHLHAPGCSRRVDQHRAAHQRSRLCRGVCAGRDPVPGECSTQDIPWSVDASTHTYMARSMCSTVLSVCLLACLPCMLALPA